MSVSGIASLLRAVTSRCDAPWLRPMPPPMTTPSMKAINDLGKL
ncbi:MAG: hypothetical protein ACD_23C00261G0002 [uncultured bacterium]|nr:MAG: hypothetical protein ACD_23C00261G0002 [uncultured bacterium]